ncbi:MAG: NAD(P)/FAD-dependent oxidoreductase [Magnetococcales bacterium]|nr:NAD(P)/FAD-dependent oxidoreductase [Magnetococcales bacterium]
MKEKLILIGNGMAGMKTIEELIAKAPDRYDITVFGAEPHGNYNRIMLSPVLAGEKELHEIMINTTQWYQDNNIQLSIGNPVEKIDRAKKQVVAKDGTTVSYDKLMLATGSDPVIIPFPGHDLDGVVAFRDIKDVEMMVAAAKSSKKAVVIGGGLLGLEAANGLLKRGMEVTVVHLMDILMERQLDAVSAAMLKSELEEQGMKFLLGASTKSILGENGKVTGVSFKDGSSIDVDLVVMAVGVRPSIALAKDAGLDCERGIIVDDLMVTSDPDIVAVGECVEHRGDLYGLVAPLYEQGRVLANYLAGDKEPGAYTGSTVSTRLKVTGIDLFSSGDINGDDNTDEIIFRDPSRSVYKKLIIRNNQIQGAVLLGDAADGLWYLDLMKQKTDISDIRDTLLFGQSAIGGEASSSNTADMPMDKEICGCNGVKKQTIVDTILAKGLKTVEEVKAFTKAASSCGSCVNLVEGVLADTLGGEYVAISLKPLCGCTKLSSDDVRDEIKQNKLTTHAATYKSLNFSSSDGCPTCRQAINYYIHALWPAEHKENPQSRFINERVHANIQKDGTYSVIPRIFGGVTSPDQLRAIADIVDKYSIPEVKFTGGQRLTMLGVKKEDLPKVWADLGTHDMVSGHAYGKAMRTVKTCVGDKWCRFGTQSSEAMGVTLEELTWNVWTPHKYKLAVSGCPRNCAEATIKDFGVVGVDSGWELHVGGNGGIKVRETDLLVKVETTAQVEEYAAAFMQFYRKEARYLERTAPFIERVGIDYVKSRIVEDELGRKKLADEFKKAHKNSVDPWKEQIANGEGGHEFTPLYTVTQNKEKVA